MDEKSGIGYYLAALGNGPLKVAATFLVSMVCAYWAAAPEVLRAAVVAAGVLFLCDTILGATRALAERRFSSIGFGRAITKFIVYATSFLAGWAIDYALGLEAFAQLGIALLIVIREGSSAMETSAALGFPWPAPIRERLERLREEVEGGDIPPTGMETTAGDDDDE